MNNGGTSHSMGLIDYGTRLYDNDTEVLEKLKNKAYESLGIFPGSHGSWKELEEFTGRPLLMLSISDFAHSAEQRRTIVRSVCEKLHRSSNGLDVFAKFNFLMPDSFSREPDEDSLKELKTLVENDFPGKTYEKARSEEETYYEVEVRYLQIMLDKVCGLPVDVKLKKWPAERDDFSKKSEDETKKVVHWWTGKIFIENNDEFRALASYPSSGLASGDDTLSQAFSFSTDFPILPFYVSSHGLHLKTVMYPFLEGKLASDRFDKPLPSYPLLALWVKNLMGLTDDEAYKEARKQWATEEGFAKLLGEWRDLQAWVRENKDIKKNLEFFLKNERSDLALFLK